MAGKTITILDDSQWTGAGFSLNLQIDPASTALGVIEACFIHFSRVSGYVWSTDEVLQWLNTGRQPARVQPVKPSAAIAAR